MSITCYVEKMTALENLTDEELVVLAQTGNRRALDLVVGRYVGVVRTKSRYYFMIGAEKEDIFQEGMIGVLKAVKDYRREKPASFRVFAEICMHRKIMTAIKSATRLKHIPLNSYISIDKPLVEGDIENSIIDSICMPKVLEPEEIYLGTESLTGMEQEIRSLLSRLEWQVLEKYLSGMSFSDIAKEMDRGYKSIDNAIHRARKKIISHLKTKY